MCREWWKSQSFTRTHLRLKGLINLKSLLLILVNQFLESLPQIICIKNTICLQRWVSKLQQELIDLIGRINSIGLYFPLLMKNSLSLRRSRFPLQRRVDTETWKRIWTHFSERAQLIKSSLKTLYSNHQVTQAIFNLYKNLRKV